FGKLLSVSWLRLFGKYSYAVYLVHEPIWLTVKQALPVPPIFGYVLPAQLLVYAGMFPLMLVVGWLSWNLIERHFLAFQRFVPYPKPPAVTQRDGPESLQPATRLVGADAQST